MDAIELIRKTGMAARIGVSIYDPSELEPLMTRYNFRVVQCPYNALDQRLTESGWLNKLAERGIEIHTRSTFLQGLLLTPISELNSYFDPWRDVLSAWHEYVATSYRSGVEACLAQVLARPEFRRIVVGVQSEHQLKPLLSAVESGTTPPFHGGQQSLELIDPRKWAL